MGFLKYCLVQMLWTIVGLALALLLCWILSYLTNQIEYFWGYVFIVAFVLLNVYIWWGDYKRKRAYDDSQKLHQKRWPE